MSEKERLDFVESRDGHDAMLKFAEQTLFVYVIDSIKRSIHKESIEECIEVLEKHGLKVDIVKVLKNE